MYMLYIINTCNNKFRDLNNIRLKNNLTIRKRNNNFLNLVSRLKLTKCLVFVPIPHLNNKIRKRNNNFLNLFSRFKLAKCLAFVPIPHLNNNISVLVLVPDTCNNFKVGDFIHFNDWCGSIIILMGYPMLEFNFLDCVL